MINLASGQTPEELNFNFTLVELKEIARELNIRGRSQMDKITLCLNIESKLEGTK